MPDAWWRDREQARVSAVISDRERNVAAFKPGVDTIYLLFSTASASRVWQLPLYEALRPALEPLLVHVLGARGLRGIVRCQLARMNPGARIAVHADRGKWAQMCGSKAWESTGRQELLHVGSVALTLNPRPLTPLQVAPHPRGSSDQFGRGVPRVRAVHRHRPLRAPHLAALPARRAQFHLRGAGGGRRQRLRGAKG